MSGLPEHTEFTLVFRGDLRKFDGNPFLTDTPFGRPIITGVGNAYDEIAELTAQLEALEFDRKAAGDA